EGFIRRFAGSHRAIADYLAEEVISRQPDHVQTFLLRTSILDRMSAELCHALLAPDAPGEGATGTQAMLDYLERANLFVTPLDEDRRWYRYHHLFAEMLRDRLQRTRPDLVAKLHRRAARWHRDAGFASAAVNHFLQAGDAESAADVIEAIAGTTLWEQGDAQAVLRWIAALPEETVLARPRLA
ncbi:MAG: LuxR family transcriptional regulator, partial [Oscillochloridaceae bacterium]|nr:LuxR family transcriptional regulator [Chloroflexaceae bacterium]MDW8392564.1 LuxR family transcriptional regulator [Oscillochloridaceae bacterium]